MLAVPGSPEKGGPSISPGGGGRVPGGPGTLALAAVSGDAPRSSQRQQFPLLSLFALFSFLYPFVSLLGLLPNSPL